jgi:hypothetical protein
MLIAAVFVGLSFQESIHAYGANFLMLYHVRGWPLDWSIELCNSDEYRRLIADFHLGNSHEWDVAVGTSYSNAALNLLICTPMVAAATICVEQLLRCGEGKK